ncbi:MAG: sulfurtransferase [Rubrivivax sp.]|jgi:rhodanese-related sulfurtransferase|nr:sulfurtransferase [Rubrivivax sp.]
MLALQVNQLQAFAEATPGAVLLDVREPWELALARVELPELPLRHVPMHEIPGRLAELDPAQPVVCICHHGVRSAQVVAFLQRQGWAHAYNLDGGIDAWSALVDPAVPRY